MIPCISIIFIFDFKIVQYLDCSWQYSLKQSRPYGVRGPMVFSVKPAVQTYFEKVKRQKWFMFDILINLYTKYKMDINERISFMLGDRNHLNQMSNLKGKKICLSKICENLSFMLKELFRHQVISSPHTDILVQRVVCSSEWKIWMHGNWRM